MKIVIKILVALAVLFLLKDCLGLFYIKMTHLSKSDLEWVKSGDALFESLTGKRAKLTNMGRYVNNETNPFYFSSASKNVYEANAGYSYILGQDGFETEGYFAIRRSADNDSLEFTTRLGLLSTNRYCPMHYKRIEINGRIFNDCIIIDSSNAEYLANGKSDDKLKITKFIINKKYGLLYYEFKNGEQYYRKFKNKQELSAE